MSTIDKIPAANQYREGYIAGAKSCIPIVDPWGRLVISANEFLAREAKDDYSRGYVAGRKDISRGRHPKFVEGGAS